MIGQRLAFYFGLLLGISACGSLPPSNSVTVAGLLFYNNTATPIHNAKLSVTTTHGLVACGLILPGMECSTTFPVRQYQHNPIVVTWEHNGRTWSSGEFRVPVPDDSTASTASIAVILLGEQGEYNAKLIPQPATQPSPGELQPKLR